MRFPLRSFCDRAEDRLPPPRGSRNRSGRSRHEAAEMLAAQKQEVAQEVIGVARIEQTRAEESGDLGADAVEIALPQAMDQYRGRLARAGHPDIGPAMEPLVAQES